MMNKIIVPTKKYDVDRISLRIALAKVLYDI